MTIPDSSPAATLVNARKDLAAAVMAEMTEAFEAEGTFGELGNFMMGKDEHFHLGDWTRVFMTVPSLRKYLVPALLWNLFHPVRERSGYSERFLPGRKYNFRYRSFCTDFVIWESIGRAAKKFGAPVSDRLKQKLSDYFALAFGNCYPISFQGATLPLFSYYPRTDHLVPKGDTVYKLFFSNDDNVPDLDTNCIIRGAMISLLELFDLPADLYLRRDSDPALVLDLYEQHVHGEGRFGTKSLSYLNDLLPGDTGVYSWVFDDHNELDPTSNINILNYWILLKKIRPDAPRDRVAALTNRIFKFLANHARDGSFLDERFQSYYPLGPTYFFWQRFARNFLALEERERAGFDAAGAFAVIDRFLLERGREIFVEGKKSFNPYDLLTAAPFLYERGVKVAQVEAWLGAKDGGMDHFRRNHYEILHLRYPSKIVCAPIRIPFACLLDLLTIVDTHPS
jgi:hypothetical protein